MSDGERVYNVDLLTRVEGEGRFRLEVQDGEVKNAHLSIFEAPRFFESLLQGRTFDEVPDIVARICGICPIAYQMSSIRALETLVGFHPSRALRDLRRLLYCGEWIESHALHMYMLHAPDYLGYPNVAEMAVDHRDRVEQGLRIKRAGNRLLELLGGRSVHPVSPRVGGFWKTPRRDALSALSTELRSALTDAEDGTRFFATLSVPELHRPYVFVSLTGDAYPLEWGDEIAVTGRGTIPVADWSTLFGERQVPHSTALHCRLADGTPYLCGPLARLAHNADRLHPTAAKLLTDLALDVPVTNPYRSIVVRGIEVVHALAEALDLIERYDELRPPYAPIEPRTGEACGATEAPRGLLWHRYRMDDAGRIEDAQIVPPTSQNQACIEDDLASLGPELVRLPHDEATHLCEQLIRAYDPCISCATHFLDLEIEGHAPGDDGALNERPASPE
jgi:coenzyme F420-reducing hydrogenase alpha subunit